MSDPEPTLAPPEPRFSQTLTRVLSVQVVALIVLWFIQARYGL